ncbi:MAG: ABC transporter [Thermoprotei archaeon]|nr:MAG: ABC transporter [Thermoprotei archaeon]
MSIELNVKEAGYIKGKPVLVDLDLELDEGELLLIAGPTGSGKSTFLLLLTGVLTNLLYGYVEGTVKLFDINPLDPREFSLVPKYVGIVLQSHELQIAMQTPLDEVLFVLENLRYPNPLERAQTYLSRYGLLSKAEEDVENLSGGEKKRLCLASSTVHEPKLLILDEPTANLDPWGVAEVIKYVQEMKDEGKTIIITEHKPEYFERLADKLALIKDKTLKLGEQYFREYYTSLNIKSCPKISDHTSVCVENLYFKYCKTCPYVIGGATFTLKAGEIVAVIGPNGSGKTTLGKLVSGLLKPTLGEITVYGEKPYLLPSKRLLRKVIYLPQEPAYFFVKSSIEGELKLASKILGRKYQDVLNVLDPWIKSRLKDSPYALSYGQKKWFSYVLTSIYESKVVVLDEPTAGLDPLLVRRLFEWMLSLREQGRTLIVLTHDVRVVKNIADRVFVMEKGKPIEVDKERGVEYLRKPVEEVLT